MEKISIIMPINNAASYLKQSLECILEQEFQDFKLILINDGSIDKSASICMEYAKRDSRIMVYHQMSQGIGVARNKGIQLAQGKYILFVDPNECIVPNLLKDIYELVETEQTEWIVWSLRKILYNKANNLVGNESVQATEIRCKTKVECKKHFIEMIKWQSLLLESTCNKLYKREIIESNNLKFGTIRGQQDIVFNLEYFKCISSFIATPQIYSNLHILEQDCESKVVQEYYDSTYFIHYRYRHLLNQWSGERVELGLVEYHFLTDIINIMKYCMRPTWKISFFKRYIYIRKLMKKLEVKEAVNYVTQQNQVKELGGRKMDWKINCIKKQKVLGMIIIYYVENILRGKQKNNMQELSDI